MKKIQDQTKKSKSQRVNLKNSIQYEPKLEDNFKKLKLENETFQHKFQKTPNLDNQNKKQIESNKKNRRQIVALKVENKNLEQYNISLFNQKHQTEEILNISENNLNIKNRACNHFHNILRLLHFFYKFSFRHK